MIDSFHIAQPEITSSAYNLWENTGRKTVMRLDPHERTAGPMPFFGFLDQNTSLMAQNSGNSFASQNLYNHASNDGVSQSSFEGNKESSDFEFNDVIDIINPLQHLPVIGTLYRRLTGDVLKPMSNIIGGSIFGGPVGAVASTVNVIIENRTGKDLAENALSVVGFSSKTTETVKPDIIYEAAANTYETTKKNFAKDFTPEYWNA